MTGFLAGYEPVEDRLRRFWAEYSDGRVITELLHHDGQRYVFRTEVYTDRGDPRPAATGYAEETVSQRGVNATNAIENCETSSVGRALANLNYAPKGKRPSREEMDKAQRGPDELTHLKVAVAELGKQAGFDVAALKHDYAARYGGKNLAEATVAELVDYRGALQTAVEEQQ